MSSIRIEAKNVSFMGQDTGYDHSYLVFDGNDVPDSGDLVARGGSGGSGSIEIQAGVAIESSRDARMTVLSSDRGSTIVSAANAEGLWSLILQTAGQIEAAAIRYTLPGGAVAVQNSNSVTATLLHAVGFDIRNSLPMGSSLAELVGGETILDFSRDLVGSDDADVIVGWNQADRLSGADGNDTLSGGLGDDQLNGGRGNDILHGNEGADRLYGGVGADQLFGGPGDDILAGGAGNDTFLGGSGADVFLFQGEQGRDIITSFSDDDVLVTTSPLRDNNRDGVIDFGSNHKLDFSRGSTARIFDDVGHTVTALEYDGSYEAKGQAYYVYSLVGSATGVTTAATHDLMPSDSYPW